MDADMKPLVISALIIGLLSTIWAGITWLPLALGEQVCEYSEPRQFVAVFEFACIVAGLFYLVYVIIKFWKAH
jgi:hypothetical protein